ncbi:MAG: integrase domain-containing protein [Gallionella sp.]|nr:integrase domain-containing protein [Gallionella sp.]
MTTEEKIAVKPGRVDGKNSTYISGSHRIPGNCHNEIELALQKNKDQAAHKDKKVGQGTQDKRRTVIRGFFSDLFHLGYKIESVHNLKEKHLIAVFNFLEEQGQSPSTIQNKISIMRVFCEWIGKNGMVRDSTLYVKDKTSVRRSMVVKEDKSWDGKGIDITGLLLKVAQEDKTVAMVLELCMAFGLRVKEAMMLRPSVCHEGEFLSVREGTKGDRPRFVPIENAIQKNVLERAKAMEDKKSGFLGERGLTFQQKRDRLYYVLKKCEVTLSENDITAHGLRHQYMQESFERLLGIQAPVKGGDLSLVDGDDLHLASQKLMERAGHTRVTIGASYYGSRRITKKAVIEESKSASRD